MREKMIKELMSEIKEDYGKNPQKTLDEILQYYNETKKLSPYSVTDKTILPASGDANDYFSLSIYWWPNPDTKDGLPYIRRDGVVNPESKELTTDAKRITLFSNHVLDSCILYALTKDQEYYDEIDKNINSWFVNPKTRMNPNANHSQCIKGQNTGKAGGILDIRQVIRVLDGLKALKSDGIDISKWMAPIQKWIKEFIVWLNTSKFGATEFAVTNNHGFWFDAQAMAYASIAKDQDLMGKLQKNIIKRIHDNIEINGSLKEELERTRPWHYSWFLTEAILIAHTHAMELGVNIFSEKSTHDKMKKVFEFLHDNFDEDKCGSFSKDSHYQDEALRIRRVTGLVHSWKKVSDLIESTYWSKKDNRFSSYFILRNEISSF